MTKWLTHGGVLAGLHQLGLAALFVSFGAMSVGCGESPPEEPAAGANDVVDTDVVRLQPVDAICRCSTATPHTPTLARSRTIRAESYNFSGHELTRVDHNEFDVDDVEVFAV